MTTSLNPTSQPTDNQWTKRLISVPSPINLKQVECLNGGHYLVPNELNPHQVLEHLKKQHGGLHFCTGTERFFSNTALCPYDREAFIGIDFDPHVKAYNDFNIMLLHLASSQDHYCKLATPPTDLAQRIQQINEALAKSSIAPAWQSYYTNHIEIFAPIFYEAKRCFFKLCQTHKGLLNYQDDHNKEAFDKLQAFAKQGKLISLCRDISNLADFDPAQIAEIDISNICDYSWLHFNTLPTDKVIPLRIIWTQGVNHDRGTPNTAFFSFDYTPWETEDKKRVDAIQRKIDAVDDHLSIGRRSANPSLLNKILPTNTTRPLTNRPVIASCSKEALSCFLEYERDHFFGSEAIGSYDTAIDAKRSVKTWALLGGTSPDHINTALQKAGALSTAFIQYITEKGEKALPSEIYNLFKERFTQLCG